MNSYDEYNVIETEIKHVGRFDIVCEKVLCDDEKVYPYSYVKIKNCAAVLCIIDNKVLLLEQYRHTLRSWEYEIPAGVIEDNEEPIAAAKREVMEETGYHVTDLTSLGWYHLSVGSTTEKVYLFTAILDKKSDQRLEKLEKIRLSTVTFEEFENMIKRNDFHQCMGVAAWERYKQCS